MNNTNTKLKTDKKHKKKTFKKTKEKKFFFTFLLPYSHRTNSNVQRH